MAKTSPTDFFRQVQTEARKIVWPTTRETVTTTIMVVIMTTMLGVFFLTIDSMFSWIVSTLLGLAAGTR